MSGSANPLSAEMDAVARDPRTCNTVVYEEALSRLIADYPALSAARIESTLLREWEVFTSGRPQTIPLGVEVGTREMLERLR